MYTGGQMQNSVRRSAACAYFRAIALRTKITQTETERERLKGEGEPVADLVMVRHANQHSILDAAVAADADDDAPIVS